MPDLVTGRVSSKLGMMGTLPFSTQIHNSRQVGEPSVEVLADSFQVTRDLLQYKNKISPYMGLELKGRVEETYLRGQKVYSSRDNFQGLPPTGQLL